MLRVAIDRGGTFTDCILVGEGGVLATAKVLSSDDAPARGVELLLERAGLPRGTPCTLGLGTTVATNALLERRGARVALVVSEGFEDILEIGNQSRKELFDLRAARAAPLVDRVIATTARGAPWGEVVAPVDAGPLLERLRAARAAGCDAAVVAVVHATATPDLELEIAHLARTAGFSHVVSSHEASRRVGLLHRTETALVDAYLTPGVTRAVATLARAVPRERLSLMQSTGDLVSADAVRGVDLVLSGPAGGVVATRALAIARGLEAAIAFDMGGTSTDVARVTAELRFLLEGDVGGVRVLAPHVAIDTVAAGGGSVVRARDGALVVGPESAGATPGPLVYGRAEASELTLTDLHVLLGRLPGDRFPFALDDRRADDALSRLARTLGHEGERALVAEAALALADARMAEAIRRVTVARGHDAATHTLVVYGGAGGLHMCGVADRLDIRRILVPPRAGLFSAWGIALAERGETRAVDIGPLPLDDDALTRARETARTIADELATRVGAAEDRARPCTVTVSLGIRERGLEAAHEIDDHGSVESSILASRFRARLRSLYGFASEDAPLELAHVLVRVSRVEEPVGAGAVEDGDGVPVRHARLFVDGAWRDRVPLIRRESLVIGREIFGPAVVLDADATSFVAPGFVARREHDGALLVERRAGTFEERATTRVKGARLSLASGAFTAIAEEMGEILRRTARSVNMRERLDFSCALFDGDGSLVVNAPHIPVHLGAMQESVRAVVAAHPAMRAGDAFVTNDPSAGGSHLPDLTVVTPVFVDDKLSPAFFVASRGHHADIGGSTPGSMPPFSATLEDEGIVFSAARLARAGVIDEDALVAKLKAPPFPARDVATNVADLRATLAANHRGALLLEELARAQGTRRVAEDMHDLRVWSARAIRDAIARMPEEARSFEDALDDGTPVVVRIERRGDRLDVDFTGSGAPVAGNLNAPRAVTVAAVLYVLRILAGRPIPLSAGCLEPVNLTIPSGSVLDAPPGVAVCGGNVETSQRVVDVLLGALGLAAASQGTMNNLTLAARAEGRFEKDRSVEVEARAYYETIGGGAGGGPGFVGASGVQTHMTNTRITDVEVLERALPLRVRTFAIRRGSGGAGRFVGGDGIVRSFVALAAMDGAILSERRTRAPFGLAGGADGLAGRNTKNGDDIGGKARFELDVGDVLTIETPGGGGYGRP